MKMKEEALSPSGINTLYSTTAKLYGYCPKFTIKPPFFLIPTYLSPYSPPNPKESHSQYLLMGGRGG